MPALFEKKNGRSPAGFEDDRLRQWTVEARRMVPGVRQPFSEAEIAALEAEFGQYQDSFRKALQVHGMLHQNLVALREELPGRQAAVADLPLSLNE